MSKTEEATEPGTSPPDEDTSSSCTYTGSCCLEGEAERFDWCWEQRLPYCEDSFRGYEFPGGSFRGRKFYGEGSPTSDSERSYSSSGTEVPGESPKVPSSPEPERWRQSVFVHSSPAQFPDVRRVDESAFGSIFVRTATPVERDPGVRYRKDGTDSSDSDSSRHKDFLLRAFEKRGIKKDTTSSSTSRCDIYSITESSLFLLQNRDRIHQTRRLCRVEERISTGQMQYFKFFYNWPSGSTWSGHWDSLGMAGPGTFMMPHDVYYVGKMKDGMCEDTDATLIYPNGFRALHCHYIDGQLQSYQFQFPDLLDHEKEGWRYCQYPDRRFWSEVQNDLKPAKLAQKTQKDPPRKIPQNCYDTNDGFFDPKTKMLSSPRGNLLRVPTFDEEQWIKAKCRKGFHEHTGFRPDLFANLYGDDEELIQKMVDMKSSYLRRKITYQELYQFYADNDLLPTCSPFKRSKTKSEIELEKMLQNFPAPKKLLNRFEKRYEGHRIPRHCDASMTHRNILAQKRMMKRKNRYPFEEARKSCIDLEKLSWKIKFYENNQTPTLSGANVSLEWKDSGAAALKRHRQEEGEGPVVAGVVEGAPDASSLSSYDASDSLQPSRPSSSTLDSHSLIRSMKKVIMKIVDDIVVKERERHRDRFVRLQSVRNLPFGPRSKKEKCIQVLEDLYRSIPGREEFCDSIPQQSCNFKELAEDRYKMVKYWGKRIYTLDFDEDA